MKPFCIWPQLVLICLFAGVAGYAQAQDSPSRTLPVNAVPQQAPVVPQLIKFTGTLFDQHAQPVESPVGVTFALYSQQFGGAALWLETQNLEIDAKGNYTALIGANSSYGVPVEFFTSGEARWLGVQSERQPEQPRVLLVSVPYALKAGDAETLGGKPASAFALSNATTPINQTVVVGVVSANAQSPTPLATGTLAVTTAGGTLNSLAKFDAKSDITISQIVDNGSNVGIGSCTPGTKLDVCGAVTIRGALQLPATGIASATALSGFNSQPFDLLASAWNSSTKVALGQHFRWQAEPISNVSAPAGKLNLLFASGTGTPAETGLSIRNNGQITFAAGQTFPTVTGNETVTGNLSAGQLISTVANGTAPLKVTSSTVVANLNASLLGGLPSSSFAQLAAANTFVTNQAISIAADFTRGLLVTSSHGSGAEFDAGTDSFGAGYDGVAGAGGDGTGNSFSGGTGVSATGGTGRNGANGGTGFVATGGRIDGTVGAHAGLGLKSTGADSVGFNGGDGGGGVVAHGGATNSKFRSGGFGVAATGGDGTIFGSDAGFGISANGGNALVDGRGGNGIVAVGGIGKGLGVGGSGGYGIQATGGQNGDGTTARAGFFFGDVEIQGCLLVFGSPTVGTCSSDFRLKKNIQPFPSVLDKLAKLQPVSYNWRVDEYPQFRFSSARTSGLIAQEVEKVFPEMVSFDQAGYRRVNYGELPYLMLQAIRELKARNDKLQARMKAHEAEWQESRVPSQDHQLRVRTRKQARDLQELKEQNAQLRQQVQAVVIHLQQIDDRVDAASPKPQVPEENAASRANALTPDAAVRKSLALQ